MHSYLIPILVASLVTICFGEPSRSEEYSTKEDDQGHETWKWTCIILIFVIFFLLLFIFRRQLWNALKKVDRQKVMTCSEEIVSFVKKTCTFQQRTTSPISEYDFEPSEIISLCESVQSNYLSHPVDVKNFEKYVRQSITDDVLKSQFKMLPKGPVKDTGCGSLPQNRVKNRYLNIIAYDDTRVILKKIPGDPYSDYINANYALNIEGKRGYIATQGPKPGTEVDFWRMVWQERSRVICMLANVVEGKKSKCAQYWPNFGESKTYGEVTVVMENHQISTDFTSRTFRLSCQEKTRKVQHLHYTTWPDHNVPKYTSTVVAYLRKLQTLRMGYGPIIVHCSAGVGRTGTIILCDICSRQAVATGFIDVLAEFKKLRDCRLNMVETESQYIFTHLVLVELLVSPPTAIPCNQSLPEMVDLQMKDVPDHMERLQKTAWLDQVLHPVPASRPLLPEQLEKNRFPELAPGSSSSVYLKRYPTRDTNSDYISAVMVDGFREKMYVTSQLPLPSTLSDFWRLIAEQKIESIVILQHPDPSDPTCCDVIPGEDPINPVPFLHVELIPCSRLMKSPKIDILQLTDTSGDKPRMQEITILTCTEWGTGKDGKPPLPIELVELWMRSETIHRGTGPILVLCYDGVTGCGLYVGLSFLMEQMAIDMECDVIYTVRAIRRSRPDFIQSKEQIEYLYDAAAKYVKHFEIYANLA